MTAADLTSDAPSTAARRADLALLIVALIIASVALSSTAARDYWSEANDYLVLGLGHAINLESWAVGGGRTISPFQLTHPGIPFQVTSWLALRLASATDGDDQEVGRVLATLRDPQPFYRASKALALLLAVAAVALLWKVSQRDGRGAGIVAGLAFFSFPPSWDYTCIYLGNESFALLAGVLFFALAGHTLRSPSNPGRWLLLGGVGGLVYLIKLNYIVWPLSLAAALAMRASANRHAARRTLIEGLSSAIGFIAVTLGVSNLFLGGDGRGQMLAAHRRILFHSGHFGSGDDRVVSGAMLRTAWEQLTASPALATSILLGVVACVAIVAIIARRWPDAVWRNGDGALGSALTVAFILGVAATLKHWGEHYLIPCVAVLALQVAWLSRESGSRARRVGTAVIAVAAMVSIAAAWNRRVDAGTSSAVERDEVAAIAALPHSAARARLWTYGTRHPAFITRRALEFSGTHRYDDALDRSYPRELAYNLEHDYAFHDGAFRRLAEIDWELAVFHRSAYPDRDALPEPFQSAEVAATLHHYIVVRRAVGDPEEPNR